MIGRMREFIRSRHPRPRQCDLNEVVRESLDLADTQIEGTGVTVEALLADRLPIAHADPTLLVQVVANLLQNAIEAMGSCAPRERVCTVSTHAYADRSIIVSVSDQGHGLPAGIGDALYKPFFTTKAQGLGLGLAICRSVVEAHGGRLWHVENPQRGCTFYFTVPREARR
jgi:C4-dicarboxylate-specific signal transduction histidine kinase